MFLKRCRQPWGLHDILSALFRPLQVDYSALDFLNSCGFDSRGFGRDQVGSSIFSLKLPFPIGQPVLYGLTV